mgnify:CR=1 FL=1
MSVLLGRDTKVLVQGMGREGSFHAGRMKEYGTKVVAGTKPGAGSTAIEGIPLFDTVAQAVDATITKLGTYVRNPERIPALLFGGA